eukprot:Rhum_TRINITY_DN14715_c2_g1::Rhum_TRINITY_DN14715_c2_g1_i1::g.111168::m.111168
MCMFGPDFFPFFLHETHKKRPPLSSLPHQRRTRSVLARRSQRVAVRLREEKHGVTVDHGAGSVVLCLERHRNLNTLLHQDRRPRHRRPLLASRPVRHPPLRYQQDAVGGRGVRGRGRVSAAAAQLRHRELELGDVRRRAVRLRLRGGVVRERHLVDGVGRVRHHAQQRLRVLELRREAGAHDVVGLRHDLDAVAAQVGMGLVRLQEDRLPRLQADEVQHVHHQRTRVLRELLRQGKEHLVLLRQRRRVRLRPQARLVRRRRRSALCGEQAGHECAEPRLVVAAVGQRKQGEGGGAGRREAGQVGGAAEAGEGGGGRQGDEQLRLVVGVRVVRGVACVQLNCVGDRGVRLNAQRLLDAQHLQEKRQVRVEGAAEGGAAVGARRARALGVCADPKLGVGFGRAGGERLVGRSLQLADDGVAADLSPRVRLDAVCHVHCCTVFFIY